MAESIYSMISSINQYLQKQKYHSKVKHALVERNLSV